MVLIWTEGAWEKVSDKNSFLQCLKQKNGLISKPYGFKSTAVSFLSTGDGLEQSEECLCFFPARLFSLIINTPLGCVCLNGKKRVCSPNLILKICVFSVQTSCCFTSHLEQAPMLWGENTCLARAICMERARFILKLTFRVDQRGDTHI